MKTLIDEDIADLLPAIGVFIAAAEAENFSIAARNLGMTPAGVSRSISRLEDRLGVQLFARTTRIVKLTEDGRLYHARCADTVSQLREAGRVLGGRQSDPQGHLRISVPTTYGHYRIIPLLSSFMALYPAITLDISVSNRNADMIDEGFDAVIRMGDLPDSRLIARKLEDATLGIFASPSYLAERRQPETIDELVNHDCIPFELPSTGKSLAWIFRQDGKDVDWKPKGSARFEDDVLACMTYSVGGGGICQIYHFIADAAVKRGELVELMQQFGGRSRPFSLIYPKNRQLSAKMRVFTDFVINARKTSPIFPKQ